MVKSLSLLATLTRADDELTMLSLRHGSSLSSSSSLDQLADAFHSRNVTEMAMLVEDIAKDSLSEEPVPVDITKALMDLKKLIEGMEDVLEQDHEADQKIVDDINKCFRKAEHDLETEMESKDTLKKVMEGSEARLSKCRKDTREKYAEKINKCEAMDDYTAGLTWPQSMEEECIWDTQSGFKAHLKKGLTWYENTHRDFEAYQKSCHAAAAAYKEADTVCDRTQTTFEIDTCSHRQALWTACNDHYSNSCKDCSKLFDETVNEVECREHDRKMDFISSEKIRCYIQVLLKSPTTKELNETLCQADGAACVTAWRVDKYKECESRCQEEDIDDLKRSEAEDYETVGGVNSTHHTGLERCSAEFDIDFPEKEHCDVCPDPLTYPCQAEFVGEHYAQYQQPEWVTLIEPDTKECPGYTHRDYSAYSLAECRACPVLTGHDPLNHDDNVCQYFADEVRIQTVNQHLNLAEVIINDGTEKLTASMSSRYSTSHYPASACIDKAENNFCHTKGEGWLSVKLANGPTCINKIQVVNREDCCKHRTVGGNIKILNQGTLLWKREFTEQMDRYTYDFAQTHKLHIDAICPKGVGATATVDNRCYFVHTGQTMSLDDGRQWCHHHGGKLASIHTDAANNEVLDLLDGSSAWIGAHLVPSEDGSQAGKWTWEDGSDWDEPTWSTDGLNSGIHSETRICIHSDKKWHDWNHGATPKGVVCQVKGLKPRSGSALAEDFDDHQLEDIED